MEWFPRYLYLPRLTGQETLVSAVQDGASLLIPDDTFATAEDFDQTKNRYLGLRIGGGGVTSISNSTCLVKVDVARHQQEEDAQRSIPTTGGDTTTVGPDTTDTDDGGTMPLIGPPRGRKPTAYIGSVKLNEARVGRDAGQIADEILSHLTSLPGVEATISMEIEIKVPGGVESQVVRIVNENANALNFEQSLFEED